MPLIRTRDHQIPIEKLYLDFELRAIKVGGGGCADMSGLDSYTIGAWSESLGFGITNIELDIQPNLQPIITITFKDLYGNLVFGRNKTFNYDILFDLPYPKFELIIKGYLGKPVSFLLQIKKTVTTFIPQDNSYEIKAEFVPNIFGFFGDLPYQFLFAVPKLKTAMGDTNDGEQNSSIVEIAKIGSDIRTKIQNASDSYSDKKQLLTLINTGGLTLGQAYNDGTFNFSAATETLKGTPELIEKGYQDISLNFKNIGTSGKRLVGGNDNDTAIIGDGIKISVNNAVDITTVGWKARIQSLSGQSTNDVTTKLQNNLKAIEDAAVAQAGKETEVELINSQTIENVMTRLAGDAAYVIGYILEGGLQGFTSDRLTNTSLLGNYYPLVEQGGTTGGASGDTQGVVGEQVHWSQATKEIEYVDRFLKALYEGTQEAQKVIEEVQQQESGQEGAINIGSMLAHRLTNLEVGQPNPYSGGKNADADISNLLQRCGLIGSRYCGYLPTDGYRYVGDEDKDRSDIIESEWKNLEESIKSFRGTEKEKMKNFSTIIKELYTKDGTFVSGKNLNSKTIKDPNLTFKDYFKQFFSLMKNTTFDSNDVSKLKCTEFLNNGCYYFNEKYIKDLIVSKGRKSLGTDRDAWLYVEAAALPSMTQPDQLDGGSSDTTKGYDSSFYEFYKLEKDIDFMDGSTGFGADGEDVLIDFTKLRQGKKPAPNEIITFRFDEDLGRAKKFTEGDYGARLISLENADKDPKNYVLSMEDTEMCKAMYALAIKILNITNQTDAAQDKKQAEVDKAANDPNAAQTTKANEPYTKDINQFNAVYTQFHHLCNAWLSIASNTDPTSGCIQTEDKIDLRKKLQSRYTQSTLNDALGNAKYGLNFQFPLETNDNSFDVRKAIVNTNPLVEDNAQTSVLNMMSNICTLNNFLLLSIPGGATNDFTDLFKPKSNLVDPLGNNLFSIIWTPTPENRLNNNNNDPVYPVGGFLSTLENIKKTVSVFEFGNTDNIICKSIKAGTDDNKVTSESLQATSDIVNNQNQNKKKGFDCSMLAVMQGRSYKIGLDIIGNAQIFPTQLIAVDGLPLFTGLYQVMKVRHTLTPNNMDTSIEAMKIKYNGAGKFATVLPLTSYQLTGQGNGGGQSGGGNGGGESGGAESITGSDDLNTALLERLKDKKFKNSKDINAFIKEFTSGKYSDFPSWFNSEMVGKTFFQSKIKSADQWNKCWDNLIPIVWKDQYQDSGINLLEFICLNSIIYIESAARFESIAEGVNPYKNSSGTVNKHPAIAYTYDNFGGKQSYNKSSNLTAGKLFKDANYKQANSNKLFANDPRVLADKWEGQQFPQDLFPNDLEKAVSTDSTYISEADFFKFRGRGLIQTTWRGGYEKIVKFILGYTGQDSTIIKYKNLWAGSPYNGNVQNILTRSSNENWNDLFNNSNEVLAIAVKIHADGRKYQYIPNLTASKDQLVTQINKVGLSVNGAAGANGEYVSSYRQRVFMQLDVLYPAGKKTSNSSSYQSGGQPGDGKESSIDGKNGQLTNDKLISVKDGTGKSWQFEIEAGKAFKLMIQAMLNEGIEMELSGAYRSLERQNEIFDWDLYNSTGKKRKKGSNGKTAAAFPGTSNHGWGRAMDLNTQDRDFSKARKWLLDFGEKYGWSWDEGRRVDEAWHFTYYPTKRTIQI